MSQVISFMFSSVALVLFTMFRVPFGLSQLSMLHLAQKKELVYMNWSQKKKGITINSLQESASTMPVLLLSLFPCETRSPIKQSLLARAWLDVGSSAHLPSLLPKTSAKNGHSLLDAHLLLILALLGLQVQDNEDGAGHDHCHDVGPPARSGHLQSSGHRSLQLKRFWHCCSCGASQRAGGHGSATKHEGLSAQSHKGQCQEEGRKQHKLGSHWSNKGWAVSVLFLFLGQLKPI